MDQILSEDQLHTINQMFDGCIVDGGVGSGKSRTSIGYFVKEYGSILSTTGWTRAKRLPDLYIITTARKRDTLEWESELKLFGLSIYTESNSYKNRVYVDSWNNIEKYSGSARGAQYNGVTGAFFIFDEQKVGSGGKWSKSFIELAHHNRWILLSATPGDKWEDYMSIFIANRIFKNKTDFYNKHCIFSRFSKYPKIEKYYNEGYLIALRKKLLIHIDVERHTVEHHIDVHCRYDKDMYLHMSKNRWNIYKNEPMATASEYCLCLRRLCNSDTSRLERLIDILEDHPKAIIFYSYDYELDILREFFKGTVQVAEWNGHKHEPIPTSDRWVYLVEYTAGAEGWNCISTDTIIFFSQQYSYKVLVQSSGRINRRNTPFIDLYNYHLKCDAPIEKAITMALKKKKKFNERDYAPKFE